jgi:hypothetical protein
MKHAQPVLPCSRLCRASLKRRPIRRGRCASSLAILRVAGAIYMRSMSIDLCRDTSRILNTQAPRRVALVRKPARRKTEDV